MGTMAGRNHARKGGYELFDQTGHSSQVKIVWFSLIP